MKDDPLVSVVIPTHNRKNKLVRLLKSILQSDYPKERLEIIVVDDASNDGTSEEIAKLFPEVKVVVNKEERLLAACRNIGILHAGGDLIFLVDDDNIVAPDTIKELARTLLSSEQVGVVGPIMYYYRDPKRIWCAGIKRSMVTSLTKRIGRDEIDNGQFNGLIESNDFPNAFMLKREIVKKVGLFDEKNFPIHYDEADLGERVRKTGYKIVCNPRAKVWHDLPLPEEIEDKARLFHVHDELRAYYAGRNRVLFHKRHSQWWQFLIFILLFNWMFTLYYWKIILFDSKKPFNERIKVAKSYLKGILDGIVR